MRRHDDEATAGRPVARGAPGILFQPGDIVKKGESAIARFDQVEDVSDADRDRAWGRIKRAAKRFESRSTPRTGTSS